MKPMKLGDEMPAEAMAMQDLIERIARDTGEEVMGIVMVYTTTTASNLVAFIPEECSKMDHTQLFQTAQMGIEQAIAGIKQSKEPPLPPDPNSTH